MAPFLGFALFLFGTIGRSTRIASQENSYDYGPATPATSCSVFREPPDVQRQLEDLLNTVSERFPAAAFQMSYVSKGTSFSGARGVVQEGESSRRVTVDDIFAWGSGTKPFSAAFHRTGQGKS